MGWNPLDFNGNGDLDFDEALVGGLIAGGIGYGMAQSDAQLREEELRIRHEEELERERERADSLERELERRRSETFPDGLDDDLDCLNDLDDDGADWSMPAYENLVIETPRTSDLEAARSLARHLTSDDGSAQVRGQTCEDCAFWSSGGEHKTRGWCCAIWYWVQVNHGGSIEDAEPAGDGKTCTRFQQGSGERTTCYDCKYWDKNELDSPRSKGCAAWIRVKADEARLRSEISLRFGPNIDFRMFESETPYDDESICFDFVLDRDLEPGYGLRKMAEAKAHAAKHVETERHTYVAGANHEGRTAVWLSEMASGKVALTLQREPDNPYDPNAIAVLANGRLAGYIPAKLAMSLAPTMDGGGSAEVVDSTIEAKSDNGKTKVSARLTLQVEGGGAAEALDPEHPKKDLPKDTFYATDDVISAILGPSDGLLGKLRTSRD